MHLYAHIYILQFYLYVYVHALYMYRRVRTYVVCVRIYIDEIMIKILTICAILMNRIDKLYDQKMHVSIATVKNTTVDIDKQ